MTGLTFEVLGRSVDARRRWRRRWLADTVNGALLLTVCLALWIGFTTQTQARHGSAALDRPCATSAAGRILTPPRCPA